MKYSGKILFQILAVAMISAFCITTSMVPAFAEGDGNSSVSSTVNSFNRESSQTMDASAGENSSSSSASGTSTSTASSSSDTNLRKSVSTVVSSVKVQYGSQEVDVTNTPDKVLTIPQLSILTFKVKSSKAVSYVAGTGSAAQTGVSSPYNSVTGETTYSVTAIGKLGTGSGLFLDGKKIFAIQVGQTPFICDTTMPVTEKVGESYTFKVTSANLSDQISFHVGNSTIAATAALPMRTESGKHAYYFKLTASSTGQTGVYITVNGTAYHAFNFIVNPNSGSTDASHTFSCSPSSNVTKTVGETYSFQVTANNSSDSLTFCVGNGSILSTCSSGYTIDNGKKLYSFCVTAQKAGTTGIYVILNGKSTHVFNITVQEKPSDKKYAILTGDGVNLREGPSTSTQVLELMAKGSVFQVLDTSNSQWTKVKTSSGETGYIYTQYLQFTTDPNAGKTVDSLTLSKTSGTFSAEKSMYISASVKPAGSYILWSSSNESVAKPKTDGNYCYIEGVAPGTATITAKSGGSSASCTVTVTSADPVRFTYASPHVATVGEDVTLYATTDLNRTGVQFHVGSKSYNATFVKTECTNGVSTKVWKATVSGLAGGSYSYTAVSKTSGNYSASGASGNIYVTSASDFSTTTTEDHYASENILNFLADKEGYYASPYRDDLTANELPTTGYGIVLYDGDIFYNDMSETEAWGSMVHDIDTSDYTASVNTLRSRNDLWMSQSQADALISLAYNLGSSYFTNMNTSCTFRDVLLNAVVPPTDASASKPYRAQVIKKSDFYTSADGSTTVGTVSADAVVQVIGVSDGASYKQPHKDVWYQIQYDGKTGWMRSGYVHIDDSYPLKHDLNYTNATIFGSEVARWCMADGTVVPGLLYRRVQEANIYNYGDYTPNTTNNPYCYILPNA